MRFGNRLSSFTNVVFVVRSQQEIPITVSSWLYVVEKILKMASQPLKDAVTKVKRDRDPQIALNSCYVLSKLVAELSAEAMGINVRAKTLC